MYYQLLTVQRLAKFAEAVTMAQYDRRGKGERRRAAAAITAALI